MYAARKMKQHGWKIKIIDYPLLHKMRGIGYLWILTLYRTGKDCAPELLKHKELLPFFKRALGSPLRGFQLSLLYKEPLLFLFYPLRSWLHFLGAILGNFRGKQKQSNISETSKCQYTS